MRDDGLIVALRQCVTRSIKPVSDGLRVKFDAMQSSTQARPQLLQSLTTELRRTVIERTEALLLKIVRANIDTKYASNTATLTEFRNAISAPGSALDTTLVEDFRRWVPLSDYDACKPFMAAFDKCPCKEAELENLFAPGLPFQLAVSSATSGKAPKLFAKYNSSARRAAPNIRGPGPVSMAIFYGYSEVKEVEREPGQVVKKIPVSPVTAGLTRAVLGWTNIEDDDSRMGTNSG